jgi:hypothetical protein
VLGLEHIGVENRFFEMGGDSIKAVLLINKLQKILGEYVYVTALFEKPTIAGLASYLKKHYPASVDRLAGDKKAAEESSQTIEVEDEGMLTRNDVEVMVELLELNHKREPLAVDTGGEKNPPAVFILGPPRSGTTLLRVILGGHVQLFSPPEPELLHFNTMHERQETLSGPHSFYLEGAVRAVMECCRCDVDEAGKIIAGFVRQSKTTKAFYRFLQDKIAGDGRILVDKTASYALSLETLMAAEQIFAEPKYIHLVRHPYGMINSFKKARLDRSFFRFKNDFPPRRLAELTWLICHRNILKFSKRIPGERWLRIRFEDFVREPQTWAGELCSFLGIPFDPGMLNPYQEKRKRMTDGIKDSSRMLGDIKFHEHQKIDPAVADNWKKDIQADFLSPMSGEIARKFEYSLIYEGQCFPLSYQQEGLWLAQQMSPDSP